MGMQPDKTGLAKAGRLEQALFESEKLARTLGVTEGLAVEVGEPRIGAPPDVFSINEKVGAMHPEAVRKAVKAHRADLGIARWVYANRVAAGLGTNTLQGADALYLPLAAAHISQRPGEALSPVISISSGKEPWAGWTTGRARLWRAGWPSASSWWSLSG